LVFYFIEEKIFNNNSRPILVVHERG
jgi:hypothetical protein